MHPGIRTSALAATIAVIAMAIGVSRIVSTYDDFYQTWDEPAHLAAGLEWLDRGTYLFEPLHPPLARIAAAVVPYAAGLRLEDEGGAAARISNDSLFVLGNELLHRGGDYEAQLRRSRAGILVFFTLACVVVFLWALILFGPAEAAAAAVLFSTLPPILAHSGLATTDAALVLTLPAAVLFWVLWLEEPSAIRSIGAGVATGLAFLSKHTALMYLPVCVAVALALRLLSRDGSWNLRDDWRRLSRRLLIVAAAAFMVVWGGFRFSVGSLVDADDRFPERVAGRFGVEHPVTRAVDRVADWELIPAPEYLRGIKDVAFMSGDGRRSYLLGEVRDRGRWDFFPVAVFVKSPLAFVLLVLVGVSAAWRRRREAHDWRVWVPLACVLAMIGAVLPSSINLGSRHVLPVFAFLSVVAGAGALALWKRPRAGPVILVALLLWQGISTARAHPDYLAYANDLAARSSEPVLLDSDVDWGQDLKRLIAVVDTLPIDSLYFTYHGSASAPLIDLPAWRPIPRAGPVRGWLAISLYKLKMGHDDDPHVFDWLEAHEPVVRVGRYILLYHIE